MPIKTLKNARSRQSGGDGLRCLVTRYWPRGLKKTGFDIWLPALAPSKALLAFLWRPERQGLNLGSKALASHRASFVRRYRTELAVQKTLIADLRRRHRSGETITLLCTCNDPNVCHRTLLASAILHGLPKGGRQ